MADPVFSKEYFTGGTADGKPIKVAATATPGTTIHTVPASVKDEIWLWLQNNHTADVVVTVEFGGATAPDFNITVTVPFKTGLLLVIPGLVLAAANTVKVFAATTNVVSAVGFVNRIT